MRPEDAAVDGYRGGDLSDVARLHASLERAQLRRMATEVFMGATDGLAFEALRKSVLVASVAASVLVGLVVSALLPLLTGVSFAWWVYLLAPIIVGVLFHAVVAEWLVTRLNPRASFATKRAARVTRRWIARHPSLSTPAAEDLRVWVVELVGSVNPATQHNKLSVECERLRAQLDAGNGTRPPS